VTVARAEDGAESNRQVWLGSAPYEVSGEDDDDEVLARAVVKAVCATAASPRHDTCSCAGPRRPSLVTLEATISARAQREAAGVLRRAGVGAVNASSFSVSSPAGRAADEIWDSWAESWFRVDAGLPPRNDDEDEVFRQFVPEVRRRRPVRATAHHLKPRPAPSAAALERADARAAQDRAIADELRARARRLPQKRGSHVPTNLAAELRRAVDGGDDDDDDWIILVRSDVDAPRAAVVDTVTGELLVHMPVRLDPATAQPQDRAAILLLALRAMLAAKRRPASIIITNPYLGSLVDIEDWEALFALLGVRSNLASPGEGGDVEF